MSHMDCRVSTNQNQFVIKYIVFSTAQDDPKEYIGASRVALVCLKVLKRNLREGRPGLLSSLPNHFKLLFVTSMP